MALGLGVFVLWKVTNLVQGVQRQVKYALIKYSIDYLYIIKQYF